MILVSMNIRYTGTLFGHWIFGFYCILFNFLCLQNHRRVAVLIAPTLTFLPQYPSPINRTRFPSLSLFQVISELGLVIYSALDFGLKEHEERTLTPGLENLLDLMTSLGE